VCKNTKIKYKKDLSPFTKADAKSHKIICTELKKLTDYPVVSEESYNFKRERKIKSRKYWLLDPLDGTKEFINNHPEFTINLALISNNKPILGVIYLPVSKIFYWAIKNIGAFRQNRKIYNYSKRKRLISTSSRFHRTDEDINFFKKNNIGKPKVFGAAIKFVKLAEGIIDIYPRFNGSKEWDTAAGQIIVSEAGCKIVDLKTKKELRYNKGKIENNGFIALRNDISINNLII